MDSYFDSVKNDLVMIWDAFRHIARSSRTAGMETLVHITAFGTHYEHVAYK